MCESDGKCGSCSGSASVPGGGKILAYNIRMKGFSILYSFEEFPGYAYTAGIEETWRQPELIVFGLDYERSTLLLTEAANKIKEGVAFTEYDGHYLLENMSIMFLEIPADVADRFMRETASYHGEKKFRVLQMFWPDEQGLFPVDPQCSEEAKRRQPVLADR